MDDKQNNLLLISELKSSNKLISEHVVYLKEDFKEMKVELRNISKILETQVRHSEKLSHVENELKLLKSNTKDYSRLSTKIEKHEEEIKSIKSHLYKVAFAIITIVISALLKHFNI